MCLSDNVHAANELQLFHYCPVCGSSRFVPTSLRSKHCEQCGFEYFVNAAASTGAFILNSLGELLVCHRAKEPARDTLDLPGGFVDPDETVEQGLARELREELGYELLTARYLFSIPNRYEYCGMRVPTADLYFLVSVQDETALCPADDVAQARWVPLQEVQPALFGLHSVSAAVERFLSERMGNLVV